MMKLETTRSRFTWNFRVDYRHDCRAILVKVQMSESAARERERERERERSLACPNDKAMQIWCKRHPLVPSHKCVHTPRSRRFNNMRNTGRSFLIRYRVVYLSCQQISHQMLDFPISIYNYIVDIFIKPKTFYF